MFDPAELSLAALLVVVLASCTGRVNPGILAVVLAWLVAVAGGLGPRAVIDGFPSSLFLTLTGVTLLFALVQENGTLDRVARRAVRGCGSRPGLVPVVAFAAAAGVGSAGAGNIAAAALIAPAAMTAAARVGVPAFPMAILVSHAAIAGGMSPFGPPGVVVAGFCRDKLGLPGGEWPLYIHNFLANAAVGFVGFALFGGLRRGRPDDAEPEAAIELEARHWATLAVLGLAAAAVLGFGADVGMAGFAGSLALIWFRLADEGRAVRGMPWGVLLMVCGVSVLTALLERTGGTQRLADGIARTAPPAWVPALMAGLCGIVSVYSSTTGVVLPVFLPLVPGLAAAPGAADPLVLASAVVVGGNVADASPLSTIGALCLASAAPGEDRPVLFRKLLLWGLAMPVVAAAGYAAVTR